LVADGLGDRDNTEMVNYYRSENLKPAAVFAVSPAVFGICPPITLTTKAGTN